MPEPVRDPARTLALLWPDAGSPAPARGPRPRLTTAAVVTAATALADAEGTASLTMRRLAADLRVSTMALYTYVPGRAELLDLMLDAAYAALPRPDLAGLPWRERAAVVAEANRELYHRHPWAAEASGARPPLGPGLVAKYEHELAAFDGLGLDDVDLDAALTFLLEFVRASARAGADAAAARGASALTDEQWWAASAPFLARALDPGRYPLAARVGTAAGAAQGGAYDEQRAWDFGLARVLDGLAALVEPR